MYLGYTSPKHGSCLIGFFCHVPLIVSIFSCHPLSSIFAFFLPPFLSLSTPLETDDLMATTPSLTSFSQIGSPMGQGRKEKIENGSQETWGNRGRVLFSLSVLFLLLLTSRVYLGSPPWANKTRPRRSLSSEMMQRVLRMATIVARSCPIWPLLVIWLS